MNNKTIDRRMDQLTNIIDTCKSPELREQYITERAELGEKKIANCDKLLETLYSQREAGLITEETSVEYEDGILNEKYSTMLQIYPWYEEASHAAGLSIAVNELAALTSATISLIPTSVIGKVITAPVRKFIASRLDKYLLIHADATEFKTLSEEKYDISEIERFNFKFKHAEKWLDRGISRIHVVVYSYKNKPVMAIAYAKDIHAGVGMNALVEPLIIDNSFNKHQDYYVASMCVKLQVTHPAISRVLKGLKNEWNKKVKDLRKDIQESVEVAIINGTYDQKVQLITESVEQNRLDAESARIYLDEMMRSEFHLD